MSSVDRHPRTCHWRAAQSYDKGKKVSAYNETFSAETERDYWDPRYDSTDKGTGYCRFRSSHSNGYTGRQNEVELPRVSFEETPRYDRLQIETELLTMKEGKIQNPPILYQYSNKSISRRRQPSPEYYGLKIPPFNGKEDWRVWINRFEATAERRKWSEEVKLDNLLPKLQSKAGDFVFT